MDKRFGTIDEDGKFSYAKDFVKIGKRLFWNPDDSMRFSVGEREVVDEKPEPEEGCEVVFSGATKEPDSYRTVHGEPWTDEEGVVHEDTWDELESYGKIVLQYEQRKIPVQVPSLAQYDDAMENYLREVRFERGYTSREPDTYLASSVARWSQDARDWVAFKDKVMLYALGVENSVNGGGEVPTMEEFLEGMPKVEWTFKEEEDGEGSAE